MLGITRNFVGTQQNYIISSLSDNVIDTSVGRGIASAVAIVIKHYQMFV
jgi:hypothetical protein